MPGFVLGAGETALKKADPILDLTDFHSSVGDKEQVLHGPCCPGSTD